jgi:hypothetical protein
MTSLLIHSHPSFHPSITRCGLDTTGISLDCARFMFDGKQIEDGCTLGDLAMEDGDNVDCVIDQLGGMFHQTSSRDGSYDDPKQSW